MPEQFRQRGCRFEAHLAYGSLKLMTEIMLPDSTQPHDLRHVALRYFNVAEAVNQRCAPLT